MRRVLVLASMVVALGIALGERTEADRQSRPADSVVAAHDVQTGAAVWIHTVDALVDARFEVFGEHLVVHPRRAGEHPEALFALETATGHEVAAFVRSRNGPDASSRSWDDAASLRLASGWQLHFDRGNDRRLLFTSDEPGGAVWTIDPRGYPGDVDRWLDRVIFSMVQQDSYSDPPHEDRPKLRAIDAGATTYSWVVDFSESIDDPERVRSTVSFRVLGNRIYAVTGGYLFALHAWSGQELWRRDLLDELQLPPPWRPRRHGHESADFAIWDGVLLVHYSSCVAALDLESEAFLWLLPVRGGMAVHDGRVFVTRSLDGRLLDIPAE